MSKPNIESSLEYINTYVRAESNFSNGSNPKKRSREEAFPLYKAPSTVNFVCTCDSGEVDINDLGEHKKRCEKMQAKYGQLYDCWDASVEKAISEDNVDEWKNVRALYEHFRGKFIYGIQMHREQVKRRKLDNIEEERAQKVEEDPNEMELPIANKIEQPILEEDENMKCVGCNKIL